METAVPAPSSGILSHFLAARYPAVKARFPGEGRRRWRLRVAEAFWNLSSEEKEVYATACRSAAAPSEDAEFNTDDDPYDEVSDDAPGLGILLRTDYSNEVAWQDFYSKLQEGEAEFAAASSAGEDEDDKMAEDAGAPLPAGEDQDMDSDSDDGGAHPIFTVIADRPAFAGLSNLAALRLLNDVDVRRLPVLPAGTKRVKPPHRLVDQDGWQEVYVGKTVWIYDARSNVDQCARLVSQHAGMYGTATADSWRARAGYLCDLQVNLSSGAMTIDFGGLDRWDYDERVRNLEEAVKPLG
ncbi:hypothetical protein A0H81_12791 [Grifola frondosa]|uniref:Uncharacterized protein n=1 Tax=Grifola frondosa TaxID=5627 RepID=A0A1C7LRH5_GRIFR|nr:hypothetical protein A0H81_12791 [Grifola frondosa]